MALLDWIVLGSTLAFIVIYGIWKTRGSTNIQGYLLGNKDTPWYTVGLSIMATQASAITFLSAPGQGFDDGMRFVQFYFGLPIAMVIISVAIVPIYRKLNVYTAYEYLEKRFDFKTRTLGAILFLTQRSVAAGFTVFAPSLVLSSILDWNIYWTNLIVGLLVILYTVSGGTRAVSQTQKLQMIVIIGGMLVAGIMVVQLLPENVSFLNAMHVAGKMEKLNALVFDFGMSDKYNIWSGLIGGCFLALSYFGTDQSQVQRYLSAKSLTQSRLGLLMNAIVKIPMQFMILFIGAMLYVFFVFNKPPVFFNSAQTDKIEVSEYKDDYKELQVEFNAALEIRKDKANILVTAINGEGEVRQAQNNLQVAEEEVKAIRNNAVELIKKVDEDADVNDTNYVFLTFVMNYMPVGLIGLLIAVILSASMSSTASELNALASTSVVDIYKRIIRKEGTDKHYLNASKWLTALWGVWAILIAMFANRLGTLIEAVNVLGSLVYGPILGIFLVGFFMKKIRSGATFLSAIVAQFLVLICFIFNQYPELAEISSFTSYLGGIHFLWYNVIGCVMILITAPLMQRVGAMQ